MIIFVMEAEIIDIQKFDTKIIINGCIYIPFYQRKYTWKSKSKNDQINILWDDLINFYKESKEENFFSCNNYCAKVNE